MSVNQDLIDRLGAAVKEAREVVASLASTCWSDQLGAELERMSAEIQRLQHVKADQVIAAFDKLTKLILRGRNGKGELLGTGHPFGSAFAQAEAEALAPVEGSRVR